MKLKTTLGSAFLLALAMTSAFAGPTLKLTAKMNPSDSKCETVLRPYYLTGSADINPDRSIRNFNVINRMIGAGIDPTADYMYDTAGQFLLEIYCPQNTKIAIKITDKLPSSQAAEILPFVLPDRTFGRRPTLKNLSQYYSLGTAANGKSFGGYVVEFDHITVNGPEPYYVPGFSPDGINWQEEHYPEPIFLNNSGSYFSPLSDGGVRNGHLPRKVFSIPITLDLYLTKANDLPADGYQFNAEALVEVQVLP